VQSMIIRAEQMKAFEERAAKQRDSELIRYARGRFPDYFAAHSPDEMAEFCSAVRKMATKLLITEESDVATVLDLTVMYGPEFPADPWTSDVFAVADWSGPEKMDVIRSRVRRQLADF